MKLSELKAGQGKVDVEAQVVEKAEARTFAKFGKEGKVCNAKIKDDSGTMSLTLWNEQVDQVKVGDTVKISNGWVGEWQGEPQLSTGKFGKLEVVGETADEGEHILTKDEKEEADVASAAFKEPAIEEAATPDNRETATKEEQATLDVKEEDVTIEEEKVE